MQLLDHVEAEGSGSDSVDDPVVERDRDVSHGADDDLTVADDRPLDDPVEPDDRDLGVVDERRDQEPAELACARDRDRRVAELLDAEAAGSRAFGEATHVGVQLCDRAPRAASHHRDDEPVVGLHRDTHVDAVEEDDLVVLEPCVQLRKAHDRRRDCADRVRHQERDVDAGEVALLDERDGGNLAVRARHLLADHAANAAHGNPGPVCLTCGSLDVGLDDPTPGPAALESDELDAESPCELPHRRRGAHGRRGVGGHDGDDRLRRVLGGGVVVDGAEELLSLLPDHDEDCPDRRDRSLLDEDLEHGALPRRGDLDRRLVRLHLDERLILRNVRALLHEPARDLRLGQALAEVGELELVGHGGAGYCEVPAVAPQLIGRKDELATIHRLLEAPAELPRGVVLSGRAGIGKTALWLTGVDLALARGYRVMSSRPSEAEARLSYTGLTDLLGDVVDDVLPDLPAPQRRALEAALLLAEPDAGADERAVAAAFLSSLRLLVADGPLCLAVDDVQWLDAASTTSLSFALSRLVDNPVAVLLTARGEPPSWLGRSMPERLATVDVAGLSVGALRELLQRRLDASFPRPTLLRLWETSAGNPFYALELARALKGRDDTPGPGDPLPLPSSLDQLLRERLDRLGTGALEVVQLVAAVAEATTVLVERALPGVTDKSLSEALDAGILELDGELLRFTHPLLGAAVASGWTPSSRRLLHARLATLVPTEEERARHLALSVVEPDETIASAIEEAAQSARARGTPAASAELAEQALRLTPPGERAAVTRRLFLAADRYWNSGDIGRATALLERARAEATPGAERAAVLAQIARISRSARDALSLYREALSEAGDDDALQANIHLSLASLMRVSDGVERGLEHAEHAVRAASRDGDASLRCRALAAFGLLHFNAGRGIPGAEMDEALRLERSLGGWLRLGAPETTGPKTVHGHQLRWSGELDRARAIFHEVHDDVRARNEPWEEAITLWHLGLLEWRAGNWDESARHAERARELFTQLGRIAPNSEMPAVVITAYRGRTDDARALAEDVAARAESEGMTVVVSFCQWILGFIELSLGDAASALPHLRRANERFGDFVLEPAMRMDLGDLLEALVAAGELDEADAVLSREEPRASVLERASALAIFARCRALVLAARGDPEGAFASFELALAEHARTVDPFQHARTLLALGRTQRRAKKRGAARTTLEDALARFEALGAPLWAEQTRAELARIGGRAPSRGELTEAERRIVEVVTQGSTNKQVAAALFLTEHSVETALTRIYRKLGVRSRGELTRQLAERR